MSPNFVRNRLEVIHALLTVNLPVIGLLEVLVGGWAWPCESPASCDAAAVTDDLDAACRRALGFLELGMPEDAIAELDELSVSSSLALHLRVDALFRLKNWEEASAICLPMTEQEPSDPGWWIQAGFAQRRARSIESAETILRKALRHHPRHGLILYNLACYACVQDRPEEARALILQAIEVDPAPVLAMAKKDPDLLAIRPWLDELKPAIPAQAADDDDADDLGIF